MKAFLLQVAEHYHFKGSMDSLCFVFPNRRAMAFFRKHLGDCVKKAGKPLLMPRMCAMSNFFVALSGLSMPGQITQIIELYNCYKKLNPADEGLDRFIFWANVLISDFNEIDKYLLRPESIFANISELKEMQDGYEYLDEVQIEAIRRFVSHFKVQGSYKEEFRKIWDILLPLYKDFGASLESKGFSYEGRIYRKLAERLSNEAVSDILHETFPNTEKVVFVGLNALNECEKLLMRRLKTAGLAEFCWDFSSEMIQAPNNKASKFMRSNLKDFPQAFTIDPQGLEMPEISVLSVPSFTAQAKQLPEIFKRTDAKGIETAVVLPDENQLISILNSIPGHMQDINVTMGYPMTASGFWSLMNNLATLQVHLHNKNGQFVFYRENVLSILSDSVFRAICSQEDMDAAKSIRNTPAYYLPEEKLSATPLFRLIFKAIDRNAGTAEEVVARIQDYQLGVIEGISPLLEAAPDMAIELDFAKEYHHLITELRSHSLKLSPEAYFRLLENFASGISVPFKGEPLKGLQIMGVLETRALDFENLIILNCNEGTFPKRNVAASFIPPELRTAFGLPNYEYQDAIGAYYFYRMIQRASKVWMLFDSRTEGLNVGEESRYIKQLEMLYGVNLQRYAAQSKLELREGENSIDKSREDVEILRNSYLSASALHDYLDCPAKLYYRKVKGLGKDEEQGDSMDAAQIGSIFHAVMEELYSVEGGILSPELLESWLTKAKLKQLVRVKIMEEFGLDELVGKNLVYEEMIFRYVREVLKKDRDYMLSNNCNIKILALEHVRYMNVDGFKFMGIIDRVDCLVSSGQNPADMELPARIRVVDYKTGKVSDNDFKVAEKPSEVIKKLFDSNTDSDKRPTVVLQLYLYNRMMSSGVAKDRNCGELSRPLKRTSIVNSIYQVHRLFSDNGFYEVELDKEVISMMDGHLSELLRELADTDIPFYRTNKVETCKYCDFKNICAR